MVEFVKVFRTQLEGEGVTFVETLPGSQAAINYFTAARYRSPGWAGCEAAVIPHYLTTAAVHRVHVTMTGTCEGAFTFECKDGACKPMAWTESKASIRLIDERSFSYHDGTNAVTFSR